MKIQNILKVGSLLLISCAPFAQADYYRCTAPGGRCGHYSDSGRGLGTVDDSYCGDDYYRWTAPGGTCGKYNACGMGKGIVDDCYCEHRCE